MMYIKKDVNKILSFDNNKKITITTNLMLYFYE